MIKDCVVCGAAFDAKGIVISCSEKCRRERERQTRSIQKARYMARHRDKVLEKKRQAYKRRVSTPEKIKARALRECKRQETLSKMMEARARSCVECGHTFAAKNNVKTCSEACWLARHRRIRRRPERRISRDERLAKKRDAQNRLNTKRAAAYELLNEIEAKGIEALL